MSLIKIGYDIINLNQVVKFTKLSGIINHKHYIQMHMPRTYLLDNPPITIYENTPEFEIINDHIDKKLKN